MVGGGPTGVETAGALADLVNDVMPERYHDLDVGRACIVLVDHGDTVLRPFSDRAHAYAAKVLAHKGVRWSSEPTGIFRGCTNFVETISTPAQLPRLSELAIQAAVLDRGVGMVILPGDIAAMEVPGDAERDPIHTHRPVLRPTEVALDEAAEVINGGERIVIFGGEGTRQARAEVLELAERLQAPIGYAYRGKDILEADNPHAVGMTGLLGWGGAAGALASCDCLLLLGTDFPYVTNPDFGALARVVGLHGERVEAAANFGPAITRALEHPGPALVDFVTDPRGLSMPPHTTLEQVKGFALTTSKLMFGGEAAEVWEQAKSNIRDLGQVL